MITEGDEQRENDYLEVRLPEEKKLSSVHTLKDPAIGESPQRTDEQVSFNSSIFSH